ncbi:major facilitator superfamily domain-containing protein [Truncatella angustata]|uniref:Major facilitator superfamily domain-containing protein n=1 Tax=Truncatella angustata TaxID=152316 RepID=A0A9P8RP43_9PEZI|nr:major facilitator superfamily domain-containing protein [Truncatella angustata]KAH6646736.1 major facilitator superfamily domain-containing protein [Truncatella angustata]
MSTTQTQTISYPLTQFGSHPDNISALIPSDNTSLRQHGDGLVRKSARLQQVLIILQLFVVTFTASIINGLVIVGLPTITEDLQLPSSLAFWPASVSGLATASTLLLAGSVADSIGPRWVELVGCFMSGALMIGQGVSRTGEELVAMRAIQGVGVALHLASAVSIITQTFAPGKGRNMAFSMLGLSQPAGFSVGLVLGGVLVDLAGWRVGWYMSGGLTLVFGVIGLWALPKSQDTRSVAQMLSDLRHKSDWIGAMLASTFMALLCYSLAVISADVNRVKQADCIVLLCLTAVALPAFLTWMHRQVRLGQPALIPNSLWKNATFSSICAAIALSFAVINSMELFASLFFQEIQELEALQASIRILPSLVVGILTNLVVGAVVHKVPAIWIVTFTSILCAGSPLLMAVIQPYWPYWGSAFVAQLLQPVSGDALFTVGLIIITENFSEDTQALAGAVFNTAAQFGSALGIAILQVISTMVTQEQNTKKKEEALMAGYRASFWTMFGFMLLCTVIGLFGLRRAGRIGLKRD